MLGRWQVGEALICWLSLRLLGRSDLGGAALIFSNTAHFFNSSWQALLVFLALPEAIPGCTQTTTGTQTSLSSHHGQESFVAIAGDALVPVLTGPCETVQVPGSWFAFSVWLVGWGLLFCHFASGFQQKESSQMFFSLVAPDCPGFTELPGSGRETRHLCHTWLQTTCPASKVLLVWPETSLVIDCCI